MIKYKMTDEEVDNIIRNRIATFRNGAKSGKGNFHGWPQEDLELRHARVLDLLCNKGMSRAETAKWLRDNWVVAHSAAQKYVKEAVKELTKDYDENYIETARTQHLETLYTLLHQSIEEGNKIVALKVLDQIGKVNGLYTENKQVNLDTNITFDFE